ncbi:hypothetical protein GCM10029976_087440 [Kribbella albertanoniae]|uniref:N-acetyltransferase n=1 Tax=Kribbella albertanoniae TaxID=1266829 RepID=A0A4R4QHR7_9ACTN|nr:GNAT family N-acetyltransferase [Kribbella albertanoniae]TDC35286.1 N-acetyltransferase [Kribbella albertanoniae]
MIRTDSLLLRRFTPADVDALTVLYADPRFNWFPYRRARSSAEAANFVTSVIEHWRLHGIGRWAVCRRDDGALLGHCGVTTLTWPVRPNAWDLGFRLDASARGRGYGFEAAAAVIDDAFARTDADSVVATAEVAHRACRSLLKKLGLVEEAVLRHPRFATAHVVASLSRIDAG